MTADRVRTTIRAFQRRSPSVVYVVELVSGDRITVDHPKAIVVRSGVGVFVNASDAPTTFDTKA